MQVLKFGGTSIGSAEAIKRTANIISGIDDKTIIVLSAFSGITNLLSQINSFLLFGQLEKANLVAEEIQERHQDIISNLFTNDDYKNQAVKILNKHLNTLTDQFHESLLDFHPNEILAVGELLSSQIILAYFKELKLDVSLINALDYMRLNRNNEPDQSITKDLLGNLINNCSDQIIITQGYICRNHEGTIDNLKRGGSDYTAAIIGAATNASAIQIWTDIDGLHNNDPRFVNNTEPIASISFEEAAELAYFGAKVLHPQSILPAKEANIPVLLKNTFEPSKAGTLIQRQIFNEGVRAIAAKDGITSIKIKSYRMLMSYGFLKNVFEVFEKYQTPIDVITTSEVAVSLTIDETEHLEKIIDQLQVFGEVTLENELSIISVVGYFPSDQVGFGAQIMTALAEIPIRMISYGGSLHNISLIVKNDDKVRALNNLQTHIFQKEVNLQIA